MVMENKFSFDRLSYDKLKKIVTLGCGGEVGGKRKESGCM